MASPRLMVGVVTFAVWAVAAGTALYWGMYAAGAQNKAVPPSAASAQAISVDSQVVARALGATAPAGAASAAAPEVVSRLALRGVVTHNGRGAALIAVSGKPAKPFVVGAEVESGWTLKSVSPRAAVLSSGEREASLQMPALSDRSAPAGAAPAGAASGSLPGVLPSLPSLPLPARPAAPAAAG
ncbi:type II secretion system protein N [Ottowia thiooxydans]